MKNLCLSMTPWSIIQKTVGAPPITDRKETPFSNHDSVIVSTLVVKEHGERLLIKATPWLAEIDKRYNTSRDLANVPYRLLLFQKEYAGQFPFFV